MTNVKDQICRENSKGHFFDDDHAKEYSDFKNNRLLVLLIDWFRMLRSMGMNSQMLNTVG